MFKQLPGQIDWNSNPLMKLRNHSWIMDGWKDRRMDEQKDGWMAR